MCIVPEWALDGTATEVNPTGATQGMMTEAQQRRAQPETDPAVSSPETVLAGLLREP